MTEDGLNPGITIRVGGSKRNLPWDALTLDNQNIPMMVKIRCKIEKIFIFWELFDI